MNPVALAGALAAGLTVLLCTGCAQQHIAPLPAPNTGAGPAGQSEDNSPAPGVSFQIDYPGANNALKSLLVTRYTGAEVLRTRAEGGDKMYSLVRFDGGVPVWQFHSVSGTFSTLWKAEAYHPGRRLQYGKLPPGFVQQLPDGSPPSPLEPGQYYVFAVEFSSGATSYQAVRVSSEGSLQNYDAEPRAGTSYELCCNLAGDFAQAASSEPSLPNALP